MRIWQPYERIGKQMSLWNFIDRGGYKRIIGLVIRNRGWEKHNEQRLPYAYTTRENNTKKLTSNNLIKTDFITIVFQGDPFSKILNQ